MSRSRKVRFNFEISEVDLSKWRTVNADATTGDIFPNTGRSHVRSSFNISRKTVSVFLLRMRRN